MPKPLVETVKKQAQKVGKAMRHAVDDVRDAAMDVFDRIPDDDEIARGAANVFRNMADLSAQKGVQKQPMLFATHLKR